MSDKYDANFPNMKKTCIEKMNELMEWKNIKLINDEIEGAILSLFTQIIKEENEYKK